MRDIDITFNSENGKRSFQIASGYISETAIYFEKEKITLLVHAKGRTEFYNLNEELLAAGAVPSEDSGREVYEQITCEVIEGKIVIEFPIVRWIDNYPNCDGEYDRWDSKIVGYRTVTYDCATASIVSA